MKQSGNGYKLSKFVQKIFADFIVDSGDTLSDDIRSIGDQFQTITD